MLDARDRVVGRTPFVIDVVRPGMLHCRLVRSTVAHARIVSVDVERASQAPGVRLVLTGEMLAAHDFGCAYGPVLVDQPVLAGDVVRYVGEPVVAVVAEDQRAADAAAALVHIEYDPLPAVFDVMEATSEHAPQLFDAEPPRNPMFADVTLRADYTRNICNTFTVEHGDVAEGFAKADHVFEDWYSSPAANAAPLEPHAVVAEVAAGKVTVWSSTQTPHIVRRQLAQLLHLPMTEVRVVVPALGGGFGAKAYTAIEPVAVLCSRLVNAPVRLQLRREEEFLTLTKHAMRVRIRTGVTKDGILVARSAEAYYNGGAYATITPRKVMFGAWGLNGPYRIPNVRVDSHAVLTNTPPAGAYRGFAINQAAWAYESQLDDIACALGIDPVELRRRNFLADGDRFCTGELLHDLHYQQLMDSITTAIGWEEGAPVRRDGDIVRALGVSAVIEGTITPSTSAAAVRINEDGSVAVLTSSVEMGQGIRPALANVVSEHLGVPLDKLTVSYVDTDLTPYDQQTTASRSAYSMGTALGKAADDAIEKLKLLAADVLEVDAADLVAENGEIAVRGTAGIALSFADVIRRSRVGDVLGEGTFSTTGGLDPFTGQGVGSAHWHQSLGAAAVAVDLRTGRIEVEKYVGAIFAGRLLDPVGAAHQCEGCLVFGVGNALYEELVFDQGNLVNGSFADYVVPALEDMPAAQGFDLQEEPEHSDPHGLGEAGLPPVAPAISNAVYRATGVRLKSLPLSAEKVLRALHDAANPDREPQP